MIVRSATIAAILAVVATLCSGCIEIAAPPDAPPSASAITPTPPGLSPSAAPEGNQLDTNCNTGSLRPQGPLPLPAAMPPRSTMERIFQRGRLIVGLDIGSNLFSFRDPVTGATEGFDVDIAKQIAAAIFNDPNRVEYRILPSTERVGSLQTSDVDIVVKTLSITCDRLRDIDFSTSYYQSAQRILSLRSSPIASASDLANRRVCAARGTTSTDRIHKQVPSARITTASSWADCLVVLQQGQVDAISTDDAILAGLAAQDPYVHVVGNGLAFEPYGIGIQKNAPDFVRFINGVLEKIRGNGTWYEIYHRWLSILGPVDAPPQPIYRD